MSINNSFKKATKKQSKLRLAIEGASGSGKTFSSLTLAQCLGKKIAVIDTEHGSASLFSDKFDFDVIELKPPYTPESYITVIKMAEKQEYEVLIIDSISHEWNGEGGCLDMVNKISNGSTSKNSYIAWGKVTPRHDKFINAILTSNLHVIATMRSKTIYETEKNERGKMSIEKKGTAPIQRDSVDYEFTIVFDLNKNHIASVSKDRTSLFDGKDFMIDETIGKQLLDWLNTGKKILAPIDILKEKIENISQNTNKNEIQIIKEILEKYNKICNFNNIYELNQSQIEFLLTELKSF